MGIRGVTEIDMFEMALAIGNNLLDKSMLIKNKRCTIRFERVSERDKTRNRTFKQIPEYLLCTLYDLVFQRLYVLF